MHMYVANCTKQKREFHYRVAGNSRVLIQPIPPGAQIKITGDLKTEDIDSIVEQHAKYGLRSVEEAAKAKDFVGLCYSIGSPVPAMKMVMVLRGNTSVLVERGKELRRDAAIAANDGLEASLRESGRPERLTESEATFIEDNSEKTGNADPMAEGIVVTRAEDVGPGVTQGKAAGRNRTRR